MNEIQILDGTSINEVIYRSAAKLRGSESEVQDSESEVQDSEPEEIRKYSERRNLAVFSINRHAEYCKKAQSSMIFLFWKRKNVVNIQTQ